MLENDDAAFAAMATFVQEHIVPRVVAPLRARPNPH